MGNCANNDPATAVNNEIERDLKKDKEWLQDEIKLLLLGMFCNTNSRNQKTKIDFPLFHLIRSLGTGESGKSTVFKQFKILQVDGGIFFEQRKSPAKKQEYKQTTIGFKNEELASFKRVILSNTINQMKILISASLRLGIELDSDEHRVRIFFIYLFL